MGRTVKPAGSGSTWPVSVHRKPSFSWNSPNPQPSATSLRSAWFALTGK